MARNKREKQLINVLAILRDLFYIHMDELLKMRRRQQRQQPLSSGTQTCECREKFN